MRLTPLWHYGLDPDGSPALLPLKGLHPSWKLLGSGLILLNRTLRLRYRHLQGLGLGVDSLLKHELGFRQASGTPWGGRDATRCPRFCTQMISSAPSPLRRRVFGNTVDPIQVRPAVRLRQPGPAVGPMARHPPWWHSCSVLPDGFGLANQHRSAIRSPNPDAESGGTTDTEVSGEPLVSMHLRSH